MSLPFDEGQEIRKKGRAEADRSPRSYYDGIDENGQHWVVYVFRQRIPINPEEWQPVRVRREGGLSWE